MGDACFTNDKMRRMMRRLGMWMNGGTAAEIAAAGPADSTRRLCWRLFWVGLAVRVLYMTLAHTYRFRVSEDHFQFGWEMGRIGRALATGRDYGDPFDGQTGPTA